MENLQRTTLFSHFGLSNQRLVAYVRACVRVCEREIAYDYRVLDEIC